MDREEDQPDQETTPKPRLAPFVPVPLSVLDRLAEIGPRGLTVYLFLARHRNHKTGCCNPSVRLIARELGVSHDTVQRSIVILQAVGLVTRSRAIGERSIYEFPDLTTRMDASSSAGTTRIGAAQPHAPVRPDHTQPCGRNKEEQDERTRTRNKRGQNSRSTSLSRDFQPKDSHHTLAAQCGVDLGAAFPTFRDYHFAKGSTMRDWDAALNNWIRREKSYSRIGESNGNLNKAERIERENRITAARVLEMREQRRRTS